MKKIKRIRESKNLSQSQLASLAGVQLKTIQKYESGERDINSAQAGTLHRLAFMLGCNIEDIINLGKEVVHMNLTGMKWGGLTQEQQDTLLMNANCIDGISGNNSEGGECIVDLTNTLSVAGFLKTSDNGDEILIDNDAIIYNPEG